MLQGAVLGSPLVSPASRPAQVLPSQLNGAEHLSRIPLLDRFSSEAYPQKFGQLPHPMRWKAIVAVTSLKKVRVRRFTRCDPHTQDASTAAESLPSPRSTKSGAPASC